MLMCGAMVIFWVWPVHGAFPALQAAKPPLASLAVAAVVWYFGNDPRRRAVDLRHPLTKALLAICVLAALSVPFGVYQGMSFWYLFKDLIPTLCFALLIGLSVRSFADIEWLTKVFLIGGGLFVLVSLSLGAGSSRLGAAAYYDPNDLATMLVCAMPMAIYALRDRSKIFRIVTLCLLGVFLYAHIRSGSRGGFLGLLAITVGLMVFLRGVRLQTKILALITGVVVLSVFAGDAYWERMRTILKPEEDYNRSGGAVSGRMEIWKRGMGYMFTHPLGVGVNGFSAAEGRSKTAQSLQARDIGFKWSAAHNSFVQIGAELGVLGLSCLLYALWLVARQLRRSVPRGVDPRFAPPATAYNQALQLAFLGFCSAGFFVSFAYSAILYFLFGIALGMFKLQRLVPEASPVASAPAVVTGPLRRSPPVGRRRLTPAVQRRG
jgi:hypothetical protein